MTVHERPTIYVGARVFDNQVGGNSRYATELYRRLPSLNFRVRKIRGINLPAGPHGMRASVSEALMPVLAHSPSIVHYPADTGLTRARRHGAKAVVTVHGVGSLHESQVRTGLSSRVWYYRAGLAARCADAVITVSESSRVDIQRAFGVAPENITVIPHGVDHERFNPRPQRNEEELLREYGLEAGRYVLFVGNIEPRKNVGTLVDAWLAARQLRDQGYKLAVVGAPAWESGAIVAAIQQAPDVLYLGRISDEALPGLLRNAECFVFPSLYEGFGLPVLEAMACGTPVICSDRGSLPELAGDAAELVDPRDVRAIRAALEAIVTRAELAAELRMAGVARARQFTWAASASRHAEVFTEVWHR